MEEKVNWFFFPFSGNREDVGSATVLGYAKKTDDSTLSVQHAENENLQIVCRDVCQAIGNICLPEPLKALTSQVRPKVTKRILCIKL